MPGPSVAGKGNVGSSPPRPGKYFKLLCRFYEAYMLLIVYDPFRDVRNTLPMDDSYLSVRRRFLDDIAFLCEFKKGGDACTAIAIEELPDRFVYHVAANANPATKIEPFLRSLIQTLGDYAALSNDERHQQKEAFAAWCIDFASDKVLSIERLLALRIDRCRDQLGRHGSSSDGELACWLNQFQISRRDSASLAGLCQLAFDTRKLRGIKLLEAVSRDPFICSSTHGESNPFSDARHYIGRLADHIRVSHRVLANLSTVQDLVSSFEVKAVARCASVGAPPMHRNLSLGAICNRMFPERDEAGRSIFQARIEQRSNLMDDLAGCYKGVKTRVHAEVQVAEDFYLKKRVWADQDRYIGVSKASCYACQLYLSYHPANLVPRASHMKAYRNWCPPLLANGSEDEAYIHQRDILIKVIANMRQSLLREVCEPRPRHQWHADSHTGITSTVATSEPGDGEAIVEDMDIGTLSGVESLDSNTQDSQENRGSSLSSDTKEAGSSVCQAASDDSDSDSGSDGGAVLVWE